MADYLDLAIAKLQSVLDDYDLGRVARIGTLQCTGADSRFLFTTTSGEFLLKLSNAAREHELKREIELLVFLSRHSFPCVTPLADRYGRFYRDHADRCLSIYQCPTGATVAVNDLNCEQLKEAGKALAHLHLIGKSYKKTIDARSSFEQVAELYWLIRPRLPSFFGKICRLLDEEFDHLRRFLEQRLPRGLIHGALFADRLLFRGDRLTSIIAFDSATRGKFITDLATAVNALCFVDESYKVERFRCLTAGYESVRALSLSEWDAFPNELRFSALRLTVTAIADWLRSDNGVRANDQFQTFLDRLRVLRREKSGGMEELLMAMATGYDYRRYQKVKLAEKNYP